MKSTAHRAAGKAKGIRPRPDRLGPVRSDGSRPAAIVRRQSGIPDGLSPCALIEDELEFLRSFSKVEAIGTELGVSRTKLYELCQDPRPITFPQLLALAEMGRETFALLIADMFMQVARRRALAKVRGRFVETDSGAAEAG